ncbi:hypothetical protein AWE51_23165 [Aquimarina aggregata]|uniref:Uncharacterized protein n=1 Tax=Aquimarina aggregata TaxID=1642818 RepID=A0A163B537_9FLAO|nr:hypothetical protein [Aquimarina aggregata]KZS41061.1 hypothetical protein AWE51_23165 [Aquimarina aggregata]
MGGIIYLSYWIPKKLGKKKLGIILSRILSVGVILLILSFVFDDILFFKRDAKKYLSEQKIELNDDFEILNNQSGGVMDYYHRFELEISQVDKNRLINEIRSAENFQDSVISYYHLPSYFDRYSGELITANYETDREFKTEFYQPNGKGMAPTYRIISISKIDKKLTFEDIIE